MGVATATETFNAPQKVAFNVIADCSKYSEFLSDVKRVSIIDSSQKAKLVEFEVQIMKSFRYQVWITEEPYHKISWKFHTGDIFKDNSGYWTLKEPEPVKTLAEYHVEAKFGMFVPGMLEKKLIEVNLPSMMKSFKDRIESMAQSK